MLGVESAVSGPSVAKESTMAVTPSSTPAESSTPSESSGGMDSGGKQAETPAPVGKTAGEVAATQAAEWKPDFKFKVRGEEKEIDEWVRGAIKDADTEKKVKELYQKAHGIDVIKQDREAIATELSAIREEKQKVDQALEVVGGYARAKDFDSFFESLSIPKQDILEYALKLVQRENMSPEQRAQFEASRTASQEARYYKTQAMELQARQQEFQVQQRTHELETMISKPEIAGVAGAYNAGMNNPGAFRDFVIRIGQAYASQGQDVPVERAVQEAVNHLRSVNPGLGLTPSPATSAPSNQVVQPSSKPVIPNIQGRGTSAVKSTSMTFDKLKQKAKEASNSY